MPRRPRLLIADVPLHITQRGVNRGATFIDAEDHRRYRELLVEVSRAHDIRVHAYGARQYSCRLIHAANRLLLCGGRAFSAIALRSGFNVTAPIGVQLRVVRDHRRGWRSRAA